jgi:ABC-type lipoprotein export system ATPase subunit
LQRAALALLQASAARCNATLVIATHDFRVSQVLKTAKTLEFSKNSAQIGTKPAYLLPE